MTFVLDASVALSWLLRDADSREASYAFTVLKALLYLELALRAAMPLATLDDDLRRAARKADFKHFKP